MCLQPCLQRSSHYCLFERSEFLIDTWYIPQKKSVRVCVRLILVLVWKNIVLVLAWGTSERLVPAKKKQNVWYHRALRWQLRCRPFHPWAERLRFSGEAHPGPATFTQSSSFSCGAGLQSESRLLLCCAQRAPGTSEKKTERLVPASASLSTAESALPPVGRATPLFLQPS